MLVYCWLLYISSGCSNIYSTGTTNGKFIVFFCIKVKQDPSIQQPALQSKCTRHACFFIDCKKCFNGRVSYICRSEQRHNSCYTNAVICTQRSSFGFYP